MRKCVRLPWWRPVPIGGSIRIETDRLPGAPKAFMLVTRVRALLCLALGFVAAPAAGMQFITHQVGEAQFVIEGFGTLINGDGRRLNSAVRAAEERGAI